MTIKQLEEQLRKMVVIIENSSMRSPGSKKWLEETKELLKND